MKVVNLLHNTGAGDEEYSTRELISLVEQHGYECRHLSTIKTSRKNSDEPAFLIVAGGDGTVRKLVDDLLEEKSQKHPPIALLPMGTANNIAKTLGLTGNTKDIIHSWHRARIKKYDVGRANAGGKSRFFLESFGYGIFPYLMKEMEKQDNSKWENPEKKIRAALELMHRIILSYEPRFCRLEVDGTDRSGKFLLAEVMNTRSIGPNLFLAPFADPGDGEMEVVLVPEEDKGRFADYILDKQKGLEEPYSFQTYKARDVMVSWDGTHVHVDDEIIKIGRASEVQISLQEGVLEFLVE